MIFQRFPGFSTLLLPAVVAATSVACSSSGPAKSNAATPTQDAASTQDAGVQAPDASAAASAPGTPQLPCNISTSYQGKALAGDDSCILPPDPAKGFQFHYGPTDYNDPNEIAKFILMPGQETTDCVFFMTPNTTEVYFNEFHSRLRPGSHHMLLYIQSATVPEGGPSACNQSLSRNLFGATTPKMDAANLSSAPENDGLAVRIPASQQVAMQMHVINAGTEPILREGWANVLFVDPSLVKIVGDPIFFISGRTSSIAVGQTVVNHGTATVPANAGANFRLVSAIPHVHAHTTRFTAYKTIGGVKDVLLEIYGTLGVPPEPSLVTFDSKTTNPTPDPTTRTPGAYSGTVYLKPGDTIDWECEQTNDGIGAGGQTFTTPLRFTEQVYTGEMCNLFGMYAPTTGGTWNAIGN